MWITIKNNGMAEIHKTRSCGKLDKILIFVVDEKVSTIV